jgi:predicted glycoside hydrolase/deacetylase ChbG (UPF0249 family)
LLILNADDFGFGGEVNRAVICCFERGLCSSTTVMANQPGFDEACQLAHERKLLAHVGIHLVLRDGAPLSEPIRHFPRFCDRDGSLCLARARSWLPLFHLSGAERAALADEVRAQIERCRARGIPLTHLDSHYNLHNEPAVARIVIRVAREQGIRYVRIARNRGDGLGLARRAFKAGVNRLIGGAGLRRTRYFGSLEDRVSSPADGSWEVMLHPRRVDGGGVIADDWQAGPLDDAIALIDPERRAVSFTGARHGQ